MKRSTLNANVAANMTATKNALKTLWDNINKGQQKQLVKIEEVKELLDRYGVEYLDKLKAEEC